MKTSGVSNSDNLQTMVPAMAQSLFQGWKGDKDMLNWSFIRFCCGSSQVSVQ